MVNSGYINLQFTQLGGLSPIEVHQSMLSPVQALETIRDKNMRKGVYTQDFYIRPVFGKPRLGIDYAELESLENNILIRMVITYIIDSVTQTEFNITPIKEEDEVSTETQKNIDTATEFFGARKWMESWNATLRRMLPDLLLYDCGILIKVFGKECYDEHGVLKEDNKTPPLELSSRDGRSFLVDCDPYGRITKYWQYSFMNIQSTPIRFAHDEIIYIMARPQSRSVYGIASLQIVKDVLDYLDASISAQRKYYENNFPIAGQIDHPDIVDPEELLKRAQMYKETLKGEQNTGRWIITAGGTKVTPLQISAQNMQWIESSKYFQTLIFALYKLSPSQLGFQAETNRATALVDSQKYKQEGVRTILTLLENYINREIIWKYFGEDIKFEFDGSLDLQDEKQRADIDHIQLTDGTITINEIRSRDGKENFGDDFFNAPFASQVAQQKIMEAGMGGEEEGESEEYTEYSEVEEPPEQPGEGETEAEKSSPETPSEKFEKAVSVETSMGEPGAAFIPIVWDKKDKKKKKKEEEEKEEKTKKDLDKWSEEMNDAIVGDLKQLYDVETKV